MSKLKLAGKTYSPGKTLGANDFKDMLESGYTADSILRRAKEAGISIGEGARQAAKQSKAASIAPAPEVSVTPPEFTYNILPDGDLSQEINLTAAQAADYKFQSGLLTLQGNIDQEKLKIQGLTTTKIADIGRQASDFAATESRMAQQYVADRSKEAAENVETIRGTNAINLQGIVNAGMKDVEEIRKSAGKDIETIRGQFGVEQESTRQRGQKDIAKISERAGLNAALIGAFNF